MVHVATLLVAPIMQVYPLCQTQVGLLLADKALTEVLLKHFDYADIFLFDLMIKLPENTDINKHTIELVKGKQLSYGPIYSLETMERETLKTYMETYLKTRIIQSFKSPISAPIFFDQKPDRSLYLCINY